MKPIKKTKRQSIKYYFILVLLARFLQRMGMFGASKIVARKSTKVAYGGK